MASRRPFVSSKHNSIWVDSNQYLLYLKVLLDHSTFPAENLATNVPLFSLFLPIPVDKAPPLVTWSKFAPSIWTNWENEREPMEVKPLSQNPLKPGDRLSRFCMGVCRGYSRSTILAGSNVDGRGPGYVVGFRKGRVYEASGTS